MCRGLTERPQKTANWLRCAGATANFVITFSVVPRPVQLFYSFFTTLDTTHEAQVFFRYQP